MIMKILVIEDTHLETAKKALQDGEHSFVFAATYEEAMEHFASGRIEGVISDLFFPSQTNWGLHYNKRFLKRTRSEPAFNKEMEGNPYLGKILEMRTLSENPSGLAIVEHCLTNGIHCIVVSAGNRHRGNLAAVRYTIPHLTPFNTVDHDPLRKFVLGGGVEDPPKDNLETWTSALEHLVKKWWCE